MTQGETRAEIKRILSTFTKAERDRIIRLIELTLDYVRFLEIERERKKRPPPSRPKQDGERHTQPPRKDKHNLRPGYNLSIRG